MAVNAAALEAGRAKETQTVSIRNRIRNLVRKTGLKEKARTIGIAAVVVPAFLPSPKDAEFIAGSLEKVL